MDQIVRLDSHQEATLEDAADQFIAKCHGDVRKALKEMMVVNAHLNDQLERIISDRLASLGDGHRIPRGSNASFR
jgi:hypothetical protein